MAKEKEKTAEIIRSGYVKECLVSNTLYTLHFGPEDKVTAMEIPRTWFRGVGRPKKGSKITIVQENGVTTRMLIDNKQFHPSLNPLTLQHPRP